MEPYELLLNLLKLLYQLISLLNDSLHLIWSHSLNDLIALFSIVKAF